MTPERLNELTKLCTTVVGDWPTGASVRRRGLTCDEAEEVLAEVKRLLETTAEDFARVSELTTRVLSLKAENAALRQDAERYQYICENHVRRTSLHMNGSAVFYLGGHVRERAITIDAAIDAARKGSE